MQTRINKINSTVNQAQDSRPNPHSETSHLQRRLLRSESDLPEFEEVEILAAFDEYVASIATKSAAHFGDWHEIHVARGIKC